MCSSCRVLEDLVNSLHVELVSEMASVAVCYMYDAMELPRDTSSIVRLVQTSKSCTQTQITIIGLYKKTRK